jgi:hypothetical protein
MSATGKLDYSIDSAKLTSSTGEVLEFKDLITAVDIYESLLSPYIKVELTIVDSSNLLEVAPIIGQEKVEIQITEANKKIKKTFYVGSIANYVRANGSAAMYVMKLITPEQMMNSLMLVSQSYTGLVSDSIEKIVTDYLKGKIKNIEKTVGSYRVVIPNWNPFKAIEWLAKRGINGKQTPFAFYETLLDGFIYESYETMFNKIVYNRFVHKSGTPATSDSDNQQASYNVAIEYDLKEYSSTYKNTLRGTFGSGMHVVDIATKNYKLLKYNYQDDFKKKSHLDKGAFLNPEFKVEGKGINEYDAVHYVENKNTKAFGKLEINNYNNEVEFTKLEADPFLHQLSLNKINLVVRGRCDLSPGKIIDFEVDRDKPLVYGNNKDVNEYISGKYLVLNTHHKMISGKYVIIMDVVRDSLGKKVKKR